MEVILRTEHLTKSYSSDYPEKERRENAVLRDISFALLEGECLGITGESGVGKSTLARLVTGLERPSSGKIFLDGRDLAAARGRELRKLRRRCQLVFQSPSGSFDPRRTIGYSIEESLRNDGVPRERRRRTVAELLEKCGLSAEFSGRYPGTLSGGQCQRAAVARALAARPRLLVCDEATSALDVRVQRQLMEMLLALKEKDNLSILFISHNRDLVNCCCDRSLVMREGRFV